jgi:hypothetical protein
MSALMTGRILTTLIICWLSLNSLVSADDCNEVNLITNVNSPFEKIPVYDQEKINICYAYSAAQMADYHLIKNGAEKRSVHPAWLALNYAKVKNKTRLEIGHPKEAIESLLQEANCDYEAVSQALKAWIPDQQLSESAILSTIEKRRHVTTGPTPVQLLTEILSGHCSPMLRSKIRLPKFQRVGFPRLSTDNAFAQFIANKLELNPTPISIAYCSNIWKNPKYTGIKLNSAGDRNALESDCHYHESLIVGKKKVEGTCSYLVRNTWGNKWTRTNAGWKCLCRNKNNGQLVDECEAQTHTNDSYSVEACWLPAFQLSKNIGQITFME